MKELNCTGPFEDRSIAIVSDNIILPLDGMMEDNYQEEAVQPQFL